MILIISLNVITTISIINKANPTAMLMSAIEMLNYIGEKEKAKQIKDALFKTFNDGIKTADLGGEFGCREFADEIIKRL